RTVGDGCTTLVTTLSGGLLRSTAALFLRLRPGVHATRREHHPGTAERCSGSGPLQGWRRGNGRVEQHHTVTGRCGTDPRRSSGKHEGTVHFQDRKSTRLNSSH